jgi:hypothetical protein
MCAEASTVMRAVAADFFFNCLYAFIPSTCVIHGLVLIQIICTKELVKKKRKKKKNTTAQIWIMLWFADLMPDCCLEISLHP